jgi:hypothetical protein
MTRPTLSIDTTRAEVAGSAGTSTSQASTGTEHTKKATSPENIARRESRAQSLERTAFLQQSAYILVRQRSDNPLTNAQIDLMWRACDVRVKLLGMLPLGRSNVTTDVDSCVEAQNSGVHSTLRAVAARRLKYEVPDGTSPRTQGYIRAALTAVAGAGSCGDHSNLAMHLLGPALKDGEILIQQREKEAILPNGKKDPSVLDHSWVVVRGVPTKLEGTDKLGPAPEVVLDAWADGPIMTPEDCAFIKNKNIQSLKVFDTETARLAYQSFAEVNTADFEEKISSKVKEFEQESSNIPMDDEWDLRPSTSTDSAASSGSVNIDKIVVWQPTQGLHKDFLRGLNKFDHAAPKKSNGRTKPEKEDLLITQALAAVKTSPKAAEFEPTKDLAKEILAKARNLGKPEDRSLIAIRPSELGLI